MKTITRNLIALSLAAFVAGSSIARAQEKPLRARPLIQLALLLDTSNSMDGMVAQAKTQLWAIVNEFLSANQDGVKPRLEVALYHYGTPTLGSDTGYIKQLAPLTEDLDRIAEALFNLKTNGGDEYCGYVIQTAVKDLKWSANTRDYKAIFIAGNEPFSQGPVDFRVACKDAITKGIIVNTIHCAGGSDQHWRDGALLADGQALSIDGNKAVVEVTAPQDKELARLNAELNTTYIAYGEKGKAMAERQMANDAAAGSLGVANAAKRTITKGSGYYQNTSWDLVDAVNNGQVELEEIEAEELPEEMKAMKPAEREQAIKQAAAKRAELQTQIQKLAKDRAEFVAAQQQEVAANEDTLGDQVRKSVRDQAEKVGFSF